MVKLFDTVDFSILDCALGRLGLFKWFGRVYFLFMLRLGRGLNWGLLDVEMEERREGEEEDGR